MSNKYTPPENLPDKNFDGYADRLKKNIYGSLKGKIRLKILLNDLNLFLKSGQEPLDILDAGCGFAQCSSLLALKGHQLTLCDISTNMINHAKEIYKEKHIDSAKFIHASIQDHSIENPAQYDVILCHAVLEWMEDPHKILKNLEYMLKPGGYLSLMFFNKNGTILKAVLRGNFFPKDSGFKFGRTKSLTPTNPLYPDTVYQWVTEQGFEILKKSGIRVFHDYCEKTIRENLNETQVLDCELSFSQSEPFLSIARYIHILCRK